jgi:hypothetical protein
MEAYTWTGDMIQTHWTLVGTSGSMGLYHSVSYSGRPTGTHSYAVDFGDGRGLRRMSDRLSVRTLKDREYPVPNDARGTWAKVNESA